MIGVTTFVTRASLMRTAAEHIARALNQGISERGEGVAALSGGATPEPAYAELASAGLDWPRVTFLLVDERLVSPLHAASNEAMLRRALAPALERGAQLLPLFAPGLDLQEAAAHADALYRGKQIDIALMGMGGDGHTASWFPQSPQLAAALDPTNPSTVIAVTAPGAAGSPERLTLTRAAVARAKAVVLLITGAEKRAVLQEGARERLPVDALFDHANASAIWAA